MRDKNSNYFKKENQIAIDFLMDEQLDGYLGLTFFMLEKEKIVALKKSLKDFG